MMDEIRLVPDFFLYVTMYRCIVIKNGGNRLWMNLQIKN